LGYLGITQIAGQADIANIAVAPAHRRRGAAHALLARAETQAVLRGCGEIRLECRQGNAAALALYRSRGYVEVGRRKKYYRDPDEDAVLMTLFVR
jgi:ribosomal-protein-alanine N-acetyltransferase